MSNDLGDNGGSQRQTTAGDNMGDDVSDDVGDGDDGGNDAGNDACKGDGGDAGGERGGGLLVEDAAAAAYCWGCFFFIVKMFLCGIFMCEGNWQGHTSPHTLVTLEVCRHTFEWGQ